MPRATDTPNEGTVWLLWLAHRDHRTHEVLTLLHPDIVWSRPGDGGVYRGHQEIRRMLSELRETIRGYRVRLDHVREIEPDLVIATGHVVPVGGTHGPGVTWRVQMREGLVTRVDASFVDDEPDGAPQET